MNFERSFTMKAYRHGEMILIPVPKDLEGQWRDLYEQSGRKMENPRVIAEGEITGHKHEFAGGRVDGKTLEEADRMVFRPNPPRYITRRSFLGTLGIGAVAGPVILLNVTKSAILKHPEHNALKIPEGKYVVYGQREYDETMTRRVID
jgi:hypothetical protein